MSTSVDNRVVKMTFDSAQFERNIRSTIKTLTEFEKSLDMKGATSGFEKIKQAAVNLDLSAIGNKVKDPQEKITSFKNSVIEDIGEISKSAEKVDFSAISSAATDAITDTEAVASNLDLSPINEAAEEASQGFHALEAVATGALLNLGSQIENFAVNKLRGLKNAIVQPIMDGFREYETQIGSIQTIMANTGLDFNADEDIDLVNTKLDELNTYADKTIYNFTEMTRNIGTFTAAGIDLDTATNAIQGIANLAALSGSNSQQASTAMYQLSQALAAGTVKLQDWNSVVNAGMGGQVFQEALKRTARAHGIAVDEIIEKSGSFRESLQAGWISSEILTDTLNQMAMSYERVGDTAYNAYLEQLKSQGYNKEQAEEILRLAKVAEQSATKVRTWTQLWDTVGEAIGSSWSQVFRAIVGDFKEATDLFTFMSNSITTAVDTALDGIVQIAEAFNLSGARALLFGSYVYDENGDFLLDTENQLQRTKGSIDNLFEAIARPLTAITDAFSEIFSFGEAVEEQVNETTTRLRFYGLEEDLVGLIAAFNEFTKSLIISEDAMIGLNEIFKGVFSIIDIGIRAVLGLVSVFFKLVDIARIVIDPIIDIALAIGGVFGNAITDLHDMLLLTTNSFKIFFSEFDKNFGSGGLIGLVKTFVDTWLQLLDIPGKIRAVGDAITFFGNAVFDALKIPETLEALLQGKVFDGLVNDILNFFGILEGEGSPTERLKAKIAKDFEDISQSFRAANPVIATFFDAFNGDMSDEAIKKRQETYKDILDNIKNAVEPVRSAIVALATSVGGVLISAFKALVSVIQALLPALQIIGGSLLGGIIKAFEILAGIAVALLDVLTRIASVVGGALSVAFETLSVWISALSGPLQTLVGAFGNFIARMWEGFTKLEPVEKFISVVGGFIETVKNIVLDIPDRLSKLFGLMGASANEASGEFDPLKAALDWINNAVEVLNTMTFDEFVGHLQAFRDNVIQFFTDILDYWANLTPATLVGDMFSGLLSAGDSVYLLLYNALSGIEQVFPEIGGTLTGWLSDFNSGFVDGLLDIYNSVAKIAKKSQSFPEFFGGLFDLLKTNIDKGLAGIFDSINKFFALDISDKFITISDAIYKFIKPIFDIPVIGDILYSFYSKLTTFFANITSGVTGFDEVIARVFDGIKNTLTNLPGNFGGIFKWLFEQFDTFANFINTVFPGLVPGIGAIFSDIKGFVIGGLSSIAEALSGLPGVFGEIFKGVHEFLSGILGDGKDASEGLSYNMENISAALGDGTSKSATKMDSFLGIFDPEKWKERLGDFGTGFKENVEKLFEKVLEFLDGIPDKIRYVLQRILDCIPQDKIKELTDLAQQVIKTRLWLALTTFTESIGSFIEGAGRGFKPKDTLADTIKKFAQAFLLIAATVFLISTIKPEDCFKAVITLGIMGAVMAGITLLFSKIPNAGDIGEGMLKAVGSLLLLALGVKALMMVIIDLANQDINQMEEGGKRAIAIVVIFGGLIAIMTKLTKTGDALKASLSLLILAFSLSKLIDALIYIADQDLGKATKGLLYSVLMITVFGGLITLMSRLADGGNALKAAGALVILAAAIGIMAIAFTAMGGIPLGNLIASIVALGVVLGGFWAIVNATKTADITATSWAMVVFSAAVGVLCLALTQLGAMDWTQILTAGIAIGGIIAAFALLTNLTKESDLAITAGAMLVLSIGVAAMAASFSLLSGVDWAVILVAGIVIGGLIAIFGGLTVVLSGVGAVAIPVMIAFSAGILAIGVAVAAIAWSLITLSNGTTAIANFAQVMAQNLENFGAAALSFAALGGGLVVLGFGVAGFGIAAGAAAGGIALLNLALSGFLAIAQQASEFITAGQNLTEGIGTGIVNGQGSAISAIGTIGQAILQAILGFFGIHSPSTVMADEVGQFLPAGIAEGIMNNSGEMDSSLGDTLSNLLGNFGNWVTTEGLPKLQEFGNGLLDKLKNEILPNIQNWVTTTGLPALGDIGKNIIDHLMEKLGELPGKLLEWAGTLPGKIWEGIKAAWNTLTDIGGDIINGIIEGIKAIPSAISDAIVGLASGGLQGIKDFFGIASPSKVMRDEVGKFIPLGLAEGISKYSKSVIDAGDEMAKSATKSINSGLSGVQSDFDIGFNGFTKFTPVLDSNKLDNELTTYSNRLSRLTFASSANAVQQIDASIDTTSLLAASQSQASSIADLYNQNAKLITEVSKLRDDMAAYNRAINNSAIIMDTGTLVGAIAPQMDGALGVRRTQASRLVR